MGSDMKWYGILFFLAALAMNLAFPAFAEAETIALTSGEWGPYLGRNLPCEGLAARIVTAAFTEVGLGVQYGYFPWKRSYRYALDGRDDSGKIWHGSAVWIRTEERARSLLFSDTVIREEEILFSMRDSPVRWRKIEDLRGKTIGGTLQTAYPALEKADAEGILTLHRASSYDTLFNRLLQHRIDAVPQVKRVGIYYLTTSLTTKELARITYSPTVLQTRDYRLAFSRNVAGNEYLLECFNRGLARLRKSGRYEELLNSEDYRKFRFENTSLLPSDSIE